MTSSAKQGEGGSLKLKLSYFSFSFFISIFQAGVYNSNLILIQVNYLQFTKKQITIYEMSYTKITN